MRTFHNRHTKGISTHIETYIQEQIDQGMCNNLPYKEIIHGSLSYFRRKLKHKRLTCSLMLIGWFITLLTLWLANLLTSTIIIGLANNNEIALLSTILGTIIITLFATLWTSLIIITKMRSLSRAIRDKTIDLKKLKKAKRNKKYLDEIGNLHQLWFTEQANKPFPYEFSSKSDG